MILVVYHNGVGVEEIVNTISNTVVVCEKSTIAGTLYDLAKEYSEAILVWCHIQLKTDLNTTEIDRLFHHCKFLFSYNPTAQFYIDKNIGFVDASPFLKVNKEVSFPTWQMSAWVGATHAEVVLAIKDKMPIDKDFDYFLSSLAKLGMPKGLFCYSEPSLLKTTAYSFSNKNNWYVLFRFVKQHYKTQWVFLLLLNLFLYERKFPFLAFLCSFFYKNRTELNLDLDKIKVQSDRKVVDKATIDVVIPTIGRSGYLYDILKDCSIQTILPKKIIIVEQNTALECSSELDYLSNEKWPFEIEHLFINQAGACNARNLALEKTTSEWVFLADDDIRIDEDFIEKVLNNIEIFGAKAITLKCSQVGEKDSFTSVFQWGTFGSGCSFVFTKSLKMCKFNMGYEFGYGEDGDFGMQLRNRGTDILYFTEPSIFHLKAPIGGFRTKPVLQWHNEPIQPKPSPTIMLYQLLHNTTAQTNCYKTILFFKYYRLQKIKNPLHYYLNFKKQWNASVFWANKLMKQNEV